MSYVRTYRVYDRPAASSRAARSGVHFTFALDANSPGRNDLSVELYDLDAEARAQQGFSPTERVVQGRGRRTPQNEAVEPGQYIGLPVDDPAASVPAQIRRITAVSRVGRVLTLTLAEPAQNEF